MVKKHNADWLTKMAYEQEAIPILESAIGIKMLGIRLGAPDCATDILKYLNTNKVPDNRQRARNVRH